MINFRTSLFQLINDLFLLVCNIDLASHADDTPRYVTGDNLESAIKQHEQAAKLLFQ